MSSLSGVNLILDESAVGNDGGSNWYYKEVLKTGADLTSPDTWHVGAGIMDADFEYGQVTEQLYNAGNLPFGTKKQPKVCVITLEIGQDDTDSELFFTRSVEGRWYAIVIDAGISKHHITAAYSLRKLKFIPIVKFDTHYKTSWKDRKNQAVGKGQNNFSAITFGPSPTVPSAIPTLVAQAELDATAAASIAFNVPANVIYAVLDVQMSY